MPKQHRSRLVVTGPARRDIAAIARWSFREFGEAAALRYERLVLQALRDVEANPERPGSKERPELKGQGMRTYHLSFSRSRAPKPGVKTPRHFLVYLYSSGENIKVIRILHDSTGLVRHLPKA